jgi:Domain of unknown function (DUF1874)
MKITLLNTSILTAFGTFDFQPIMFSDAKALVKNNETESSIGHASTADILSELLEIKVQANRIEYLQNVDDVALIFKLKSRIPESKILTRDEIEEIRYDFGILRRLK